MILLLEPKHTELRMQRVVQKFSTCFTQKMCPGNIMQEVIKFVTTTYLGQQSHISP